MYAIYGNIVTFTIFYHQYTPNVSIDTIHGSYGYCIYILKNTLKDNLLKLCK